MSNSICQDKTKIRKRDLTAIVLTNNLKTPVDVLEYAKNKGSAQLQDFVHGCQRRLDEYIEDAYTWGNAEVEAAKQRETDWELIQRVAQEPCPCNGSCKWRNAADQFFHHNRNTIDAEVFFACLARVIKDKHTYLLTDLLT